MGNINDKVTTAQALDALKTMTAEFEQIDILDLTAYRFSLSAVSGGPKKGIDDKIVQRDEEAEQIDSIIGPLIDFAAELGWHSGINVFTYLKCLEPHMEKVGADPAEYKSLVYSAYAAAKSLIDNKTDKACPMGHDEVERMYLEKDGRLYCRLCDVARTPEELSNLSRVRIKLADPPLSVPEAAEFTGIPAATIRTWIKRGKLTKTEGKVQLSEVLGVMAA